MITAQVKGIYTTDMDKLEDNPPDDPESFSMVVRVMVGPRGEPGEESLDIKVCTPKWLEEYVLRERFLFTRHRLFVERFDVEQIVTVITRFVERCNGESWQEVGIKLSSLGEWEFEDYKGS